MTNNAPKQAADKKKTVIITVIVAVLLLNVVWTILQNKFTPRLDAVKADMLKLEARIAKIEESGVPDIANLRQEFSELKNFSSSLSENIQNSIKAEEERLSTLQAQLEAQKAKVEALKKLTSSAQ